ncbi:hypothetical protein ACLOJK_031236 [Asimina triloba]
MESKDLILHVLMFPWLAHGHISPFLELAKRLSRRNFLVHLCSTPPNLASIEEQLDQKLFPSIHLLQLHLPPSPHLIPQCHSTNSLPPHLMPALKTAFDLAQPSFSSILATLNPDLLIYDFLQPWAPELASHFNIPAVLFFTTSATAISFLRSSEKGDEFPFPEIRINEREARGLSQMQKSTANGMSDMERVEQCMGRSSDLILIKTSRQIEAKYIDYFSHLVQKEMVPVGSLVQCSAAYDRSDHFVEWLESKERSSVVFVSVGTEYFMCKEERDEVAHGLELSNVNFIWVVRFHEEEKKTAMDEALPFGFLERVGSRGMVVQGWAPQLRILGHPSVGGFLTHCGWSSMMEGMWSGVPLIAMPLHLDQPFNARLVGEMGVGKEVERGREGLFEREEVAKRIREVAVGEEGEELRRRAKEIGEKMRKKGDDQETDVTVQKLVGLCRNNSTSKKLGNHPD